MSARSRETLTRLFGEGDVHCNGSRPTDIQVNDPRFYDRVMAEGSIGMGESYMDGWWDAPDLDGMITLLARVANRQHSRRAFQVGEQHYDIGNDLYQRMLDRRMIYS
jgi:cyclopropane-fatty-acyl-phospholipid synthase